MHMLDAMTAATGVAKQPTLEHYFYENHFIQAGYIIWHIEGYPYTIAKVGSIILAKRIAIEYGNSSWNVDSSEIKYIA